MAAEFKPGIYPSMADEDYFSIEAASKSALKDLEATPLHYMWAREHQKPPSPAMAFGTAFHTMVLEPQLFSERVSVVDEIPRANSKARKEFDELHGGKIVLKSGDGARLTMMHENLLATKTGQLLFNGEGMNEVAVMFHDPMTGLPCKSKIDRATWIDEGPILIDLKSTRAGGMSDFQKTDSNLFYSAQAAFYLHAMQVAAPVEDRRRFIFAVVESEPPYGVAFYEPDLVALDEGRCQYEKWLARLEYYSTIDEWPGYPDIIQTMELAPWVLARRAREEAENG